MKCENGQACKIQEEQTHSCPNKCTFCCHQNRCKPSSVCGRNKKECNKSNSQWTV